jgi:hypothetical protein
MNVREVEDNDIVFPWQIFYLRDSQYHAGILVTPDGAHPSLQTLFLV